MLSYLWVSFFLIGFVAALGQWLWLGDAEIFQRIIEGTFVSAKMAVMDIALPLSGVMSLWLGFLTIGEKAGAIAVLARWVAPLFRALFPSVPQDHPANGHMLMNFSANMLGLDNAATPLGLKAMESLQSLNPDKHIASDAQIMFLVLHTSGFTLVPLSIMAQRALLGAQDPSDIFLPCLLASFTASLVGMTAVAWRQGIGLWRSRVFYGILAIFAMLLGGIGLAQHFLSQPQLQMGAKLLSNLMLFGIIVLFMLAALIKRINIYEAFIEGAKGGLQTAFTVIPYLVGMLVAIGVLRNSGVLDALVNVLTWLFHRAGFNTDFLPALPTALMKPLSGSGAQAMMIDTLKHQGVDSFSGRLACIFQGAADTTFYIVALYFGSVGIRHTRYAIAVGLLTDFAGVLAAIGLAYVFFH